MSSIDFLSLQFNTLNFEVLYEIGIRYEFLLGIYLTFLSVLSYTNLCSIAPDCIFRSKEDNWFLSKVNHIKTKKTPSLIISQLQLRQETPTDGKILK